MPVIDILKDGACFLKGGLIVYFLEAAVALLNMVSHTAFGDFFFLWTVLLRCLFWPRDGDKD